MEGKRINKDKINYNKNLLNSHTDNKSIEKADSNKRRNKPNRNTQKTFSEKSFFKRNLKNQQKISQKQLKTYKQQIDTLNKRFERQINHLDKKQRILNEFKNVYEPKASNLNKIKIELEELDEEIYDLENEEEIGSLDIGLTNLDENNYPIKEDLSKNEGENTKLNELKEKRSKLEQELKTANKPKTTFSIPKKHRHFFNNKKEIDYSEIIKEIKETNNKKEGFLVLKQFIIQKQEEIFSNINSIANEIDNVNRIRFQSAEDPNYEKVLKVNKEIESTLKNILNSKNLKESIDTWNRFITDNLEDIQILKAAKHIQEIGKIEIESSELNYDEEAYEWKVVEFFSQKEAVSIPKGKANIKQVEFPQKMESIFNIREKILSFIAKTPDKISELPEYVWPLMGPPLIAAIIFAPLLIGIYFASSQLATKTTQSYNKDLDYLNSSLTALYEALNSQQSQ